MSDFSFTIDNDRRFADMQISAGDFLVGDDLETATIVSLFSDRRASDDELNAYAIGAPKPELNRGLWIDTFRSGIQYGSGIWLLLREKKTVETLSRFEGYSTDALQWMINDGVAKTVSAVATYVGEAVRLVVTIERENAQNVTSTFDFAWNELNLGVS
jgi:phage gp46-like protein